MSDQRLLDLIENAEDEFNRPFVTAKDVAEQVGISRQAVHRRLQNFADENVIRKYKPGPSAIWWMEK